MKLYIKYMLSARCKAIVSEEMKKLGLTCNSVNLGEVDVGMYLNQGQRDQLKAALLKSGLLLVDDKTAKQMEEIKRVLEEMVQQASARPKENFSHFLNEKLSQPYNYLANLFSEVTGVTIEHYIIAYKIELVKEMLLYEDYNLTEISHKLNYSSVAHLSSQFKKVTGLTPSYFKKLKHIRRNILYKV